MVRPVGERPTFPSPPGGLPIAMTAWAGNMVRVLSTLLSETNTRLNRVLPKDGTEPMTAPTPLATFTDTPDTLPPAADHEGAIIYVSDGAAGKKFRGSDGTNWVFLGEGDAYLLE